MTGSLKMKGLVKATGLPKSTILHYIAEGLLPEPARKGRNVAWYLPECVDRARLIQQLQKHKRLTLAEIREFMAGVKDPKEMEAFLRLEQTVFGWETRGARYTRDELLTASGLSGTVLTQLLKASLIVPVNEDTFDNEDVAAARVLALSLSWGLSPRDFDYYPRCAEELVRHDIELRSRLTQGLDTAEDAVRTEEMTRSARLYRTYLFDRIFIQAVASTRSLKG